MKVPQSLVMRVLIATAALVSSHHSLRLSLSESAFIAHTHTPFAMPAFATMKSYDHITNATDPIVRPRVHSIA
ncbi:hypothetical protein BDV95DRAFT_574337 [Massariosphaeria phaeospora]|uniref:Uncharacterized protein n=1 Tax=Massariosphaeria phaeospora TaxID=100035 RepID=A0A7C8MAS9_9PLEO|nr:hypothetical protein BDV95DRAFT_574337 [Massariosphaeria phaeospora]